MKKYIGIMILAIGLVYGSTANKNSSINTKKIIEDKPVDEGFENRPKEDRIKGITFVTNNKVVNLKIHLSKAEDTISIKFEDVKHVPFICKILRQGKVVWSSEPKKPKNPKESRDLEFKIDKSKLKVGDKIEITNRRKSVVGRVEVLE